MFKSAQRRAHVAVLGAFCLAVPALVRAQAPAAPLGAAVIGAAAASEAVLVVPQNPFTPPATEFRQPSSSRLRAPIFASYATMIALQGLDVDSTLRAVRGGAREANPAVRWATSSPAALIGLKALATTTAIAVTEKMRKDHPRRAFVVSLAINAAYVAVVSHNYRVAGAQ